jgi:hypothetical protein
MVGEKRSKFVLQAALSYLSIWIALAALNIDQFTTVSISTALSLSICAFAGVLVAGIAAHAWFGPQGDSLQTSSRQRLRCEKRNQWILMSCFWIIVPAVIVVFATSRFLGIVAQQYHGTVVQIHNVSTPRSPCRIKVKILLDETMENMKYCLKTSNGNFVGPPSLREKETVLVNEKVGIFGQVLVSIQYIESP